MSNVKLERLRKHELVGNDAYRLSHRGCIYSDFVQSFDNRQRGKVLTQKR